MMKKYKIYITTLFFALFLSCEEENPALDNLGNGSDAILEFVYLADKTLMMVEQDNSTEGNEIEISAQLIAFPRESDITLNVTVTGTNATEGVDFEVIGSQSIVIPAGKLKSETGLLLRSIDNSAPSGERSIVVTLIESSDPKLILGSDPSDTPENITTTIMILDDDCSDQFSTFGGKNMAGTSDRGAYAYDPFDVTFSSTISGDMITLSGDINDYLGNSLTVQAVPNSGNVTIGELVFTEESLGSDGSAIYHAIPTIGQTSSYNACTGEMTIYYDYEWNYEAGAGWEYWYSGVLNLVIAPCTDTYTVFDTATLSGTADRGAYVYDPYDITFTTSLSGDMISLSGDLNGYLGNTLSVQAIPDNGDPTIGTLLWTEELLGSDGSAIYHVIPTPGTTSTYNACTGELTIYYDYEWNYETGAGWEHWYSGSFNISK
jgi:hypothetical protein